MRRGTVGGVVAVVALAATQTSCGYGGGGGGGVDAGVASWAVPFVPEAASRSMLVLLRNLGDSGASVTLQGYVPGGAAYTGPVVVALDGHDEHAVSAGTALGGDTPVGGWILVSTPSLAVEVAFDVSAPSKVAEESARGWPLPDLVAPPPATTQGLTVTTETTRIQVGNATGAPIVVAVTAFSEPSADPLLPPVPSTPAPVALAAWETKTFTPDSLSGLAGFVGAFAFSSAAPFFAAAEEDLAFDGAPPVAAAPRVLVEGVRFGRVTFVPNSFTDFALVLRNDADATRTVTLDAIRLDDGSSLVSTPRSILLAARESRTVTTVDVPFLDLFGDATAQGSLRLVTFQTTVPADVAVSWRQFDPVALASNMAMRPHAVGHVFETLDVFPVAVLPSPVRTFATLHNPAAAAIVVDVSAVVPEPSGFDSGPVLLASVTVPALGSVEFSPDGVVYLDRDGVAATLVGLRFVCASPFVVTGWREHRSVANVIETLSPLVVRNFDDAE